MLIKRLELQGFKSFKDKTVIHFDEGITGIVGPNGCGKSNIVDAFFWVLGELNPRNLRGQSMEDLIFSGTKEAAPANIAEVSLILQMLPEISGPNAPAGATNVENPIAREMTITRRLYRDGESEYLLNKMPCRLRDIQELFMDTGAGVRGYSIVQQGKISELVNAKPEDRRAMIEDVAGITKYKSRKRESARKLESTEQNLLRVTDILKEIESQKRQMERQAEKARRYKEWKAKLHGMELSSSAYQWEQVREKIDTLGESKEKQEAQSLELQLRRETADTYVVQKRLEVVSSGKLSEELQQKWISQREQFSTVESNLLYKRKFLEDVEKTAQVLEEEEEVERSQLLGLESQRTEHQENSDSIQDLYEEISSRRTEKESIATDKREALQSGEEYAEESRNLLTQSSVECVDLEQELRTVENRLTDVQKKNKLLETQLGEKKEAQEKLLHEEQRVRDGLKQVQEEAKIAEGNLKVVSEKIHGLREETQNQQREASALGAQRAGTQAKLGTLREQKSRYEGSASGVQAVFQDLLVHNESWQEHVLGTLADLVIVESGKEVAVDAALGTHLELILTNNSSVACELAQKLREGESGHAAFADLTQVGEVPVGVDEDKSLCPLLRFVRLQEENPSQGRFLQFILKNTFHAHNLATAQSLACTYPDYTFVTDDGEICKGAWYLAGGYRGKTAGTLVMRNQEILQLEETLVGLEEKFQKMQDSLAQQEGILEGCESDRITLELAQKEKHWPLVSEKSSLLASVEAKYVEVSAAVKNTGEEWENFSREEEELKTKQETLEGKTQELEKKKADLEFTWEAAREKLAGLRTEAQESQEDLSKVRVEEASVLEQKKSAQGRLEYAREGLEAAQSRIANLLEKSQEKKVLGEETVAGISQLEKEIKETTTAVAEGENAYRTAKDEVDRLNSELDKYRETSEEAFTEERQIKDKLHDYTLSLKEAEMESQNLHDNILEKYGVELGEYTQTPEVIEQVESLKSQDEAFRKNLQLDVVRFREKIRKLGDVNTAAIEEFDELNERYTFLTEQKEDLENSMKDLRATIEKLNKISKERFFRAFNEVDKQFVKIFPALFGGGEAKLTLTDPDSFIETGVDIMAQPPGKKLQNINLLSGGEKTLTAISLIFSIFLVKPSPFCLLDEVDAPLDDANIGRFNTLLREMAQTSQFIVITHNKRTMELNDKLYGVTMENAGMSKMVSVQVRV